MPAALSYLVLSTPRSGSTLLCRAMESTNLAGHPKEYFRPEGRMWSEQATRSSPAEYVASLRSSRATPNGVFGAKLSWRHLLLFEQTCRSQPHYQGTPLPDILSELFPALRYLRISRRDKVRQAISYRRALESGIWGQDATKREAPTKTAAFDYGAVADLVRLLQDHEAGITNFLTQCKVVPFTVIYEDFVASYRGTVTAALEYLGIDVPRDLVLPEPRTVRLADDETEEWVERYHRITRERGRPADSPRLEP